jgi:multiple antibiotic resistance protein
MSINDILTITLTLFAVVDILGNIPLIINIRQKTGHINSVKATIVSFFLMMAFLFFGENLLHLIGIDVQSFSMAGAIVIFLLALEMILNIELFKANSEDQSSASIVPIAFPLIAGAGTLTTILSLRAIEYFSYAEITISIILNLLFVFIVLKKTEFIEKMLGTGGVNVLRRVFGIILLALAIKLFKAGLN